VAERLRIPFADSDALVEKRAGRPVSDIFISDGEPQFRTWEREVIAEALEDFTGILSLGGGAILDERTRAALLDQHVVWLRVDLAHATQRVGMNSARPLLLGNVRGTMLTMLEQRTPMYAEVADDVIDTSGRSIKEIVTEAVELLTSQNRTDRT
jgi:shikimate kinase